MSYNNNVVVDGTMTAAADLSALQFRAVRITAANAVNQVTAATQVFAGVLQNKPTSGQSAEVAVAGTVKWEAGAAISAGAEVMCDSVGRCITAVTTGNRVCGIIKTAAGAAGEIVSVMLTGVRVLP